MELFLVGLRNILRNRRRTILNVVALVIAVFLMIVGFGWVNGYQVYLFQAVIDFDTGHLQVLPNEYLENRPRLPVDIAISQYAEKRAALRDADSRIAEVTGRIRFSFELSDGKTSVRLVGRAIDPVPESRVTVLSDYVSQGEYLDARPGVLVGAPIASRMNLSPGSTVFLKAVDAHGVRNLVDAEVVGIFEYGYPAIDRNVVYTDLDTAGALLSMVDQVTKLVIRLSPGSDVDEMVHTTKTALSGVGGRDALEVYPWRRFAETTVSAVRADTSSFWLMLVILYVLIVLGILNSMSMAIHERTGEIATLRAVGMRRNAVLWLFLSEGIGLAVVATVIGVLVSAPVVVYLQYAGIDISAAMPDELPIPFGERFRAAFRVWHFAAAGAIAVVTAILGSVIPAFRATRVNVAAALQGKR
jgi:putative ABC transport system permease protein